MANSQAGDFACHELQKGLEDVAHSSDMNGEEPFMGSSPLTFTGVSHVFKRFSDHLTRANAIAQLPITALQNKQTNILSEKQLVASLESAMSDLTASVTNLGNLGSNQGLTTTSSDTTKVVVNASTLTTAASYAITNITSLASSASETSLLGYADATSAPVSTSGTYRLVIGGTTYPPVTSDPITLDAVPQQSEWPA